MKEQSEEERRTVITAVTTSDSDEGPGKGLPGHIAGVYPAPVAISPVGLGKNTPSQVRQGNDDSVVKKKKKKKSSHLL